nr:hypothetical protein [Deltaproteobacteria bacterium]
VEAQGSVRISSSVFAVLMTEPVRAADSSDSSGSSGEVVETMMLPETGTLVMTPESSATEMVAMVQASDPAIVIASSAGVEDPTTVGAKKKKKDKAPAKPRTRSRRKSLATGTPIDASPIVQTEAAVVVETLPVIAMMSEPMAETIPASEPASAILAPPVIEPELESDVAAATATALDVTSELTAAPTETDAIPEVTTDSSIEMMAMAEPIPAIVDATTAADDAALAIGGVWSPKMPVATTAATLPWRMSRGVVTTSQLPVVPSLVIDDSDPDMAEQEREERLAAKERSPRARSFLPPILLDRDDRSGRQGGLTLAVIILLIAATLTLSYLMRRPSSSGDGVTVRQTTTQSIG